MPTNETTTNRGWTIPYRGERPWYDSAKALFEEIDADVQTAIDAAGSGGAYADGTTITGAGTSLDPFVAVQQVGDNETITGTGTVADPFVAVLDGSVLNPGICVDTPILASAISINYTSRVLTITPPLGHFHFYTTVGGIPVKRTKTGPVDFPAFTNTSGMWFFYFNAAGDPVTTQQAWTYSDFYSIAPVYRILWNATLTPDSAKSVGEAWECHLNDVSAAEHSHMHSGGTRHMTGQELTHNAISSGAPNANGLNTCVGYSGGTNQDDNLPYTIVNGTGSAQWEQDLGTNTPALMTTLTGGKIPVRYQDSGGLLSNIDSGRFPFAFSAGNLIEYITSAGVRTVPGSGNFVVYFDYAFQDPRNGLQIKCVSSGAEYSSLVNAQAVSWATVQSAYPSLADNEIRPLYRRIYEYRSAYDVAVKKAALREVQDIRKQTAVTVTAAAGSVSAAAVTYVPAAPLTSTNVQAVILEVSQGLPAVITTSNDGTTSLTASSVRRQLVTGSGSNHVISLPDATTLLQGDRFEIENASSEFVIVKNSGTASSIFEFVPPKYVATFRVNTISTAAGAWVSTLTAGTSGDPGSRVFDDFERGFASLTTSVGTGAVCSPFNAGTKALDSHGYMYHQTGTSSSTAQSVCYSSGWYFDGGTAMCQWRADVNTAPSAGDDFVAEWGFGATVTAAEATNGCIIRYPSSASGLTTFQAYTMSAASTTTIDTLVNVAAAVYNVFSVVVNSGRTRVDFYINKAKVGTSTTNIPSSSILVNAFSKIAKTAGTSTRYMYTDSMLTHMARTTARY